MKMLFSLTRGTQNNVIEVPIDAQGHISIDPNSENGKMLFEMDVKGHAVFKGKFAEVAQSLGMKNGVEQMGILATHTGDGLGPIKDVIDIPAVDKTSTFLQVAEHSTKFMIPSDYEVDWPFVIPMAGRRPMEPVIGRKRKSRLPIFDSPVEMGGYYEGSGSYGGDFSGSVLGNKSLDVKGYFSRVEDLKPQLAEAEIRSLMANPVYSKELHYIIEKIDEVRNNKEIFDKLHRQYKFQYGSEISEDDFREKIIDTYLKMARNVLIDKAVIGGKPFNREFYDNSPIIKGINDAQEIVVMYDPPLGDTILDVPIITCLEKYFKLNDMRDKEIVIVTKHAEMFQDFVANNSKIRIVSTKLDKDVRDAFAGEKKRYIINDNKGFRDSSIFGLSEDEFKDEKNVLNVHYSSWTLEQAPEERSKTGNTALKFYYPLPLRVIRNMEMMLGTKLYDNLGKLDSFWPPIDQFEDRSRRKREELGLSEDDQILTVSFASSIVPKEYEPSKWLEAINSFMNTAPANLKIVFIQDLNDEKARKYQQEVIDKLPESVRDRSRVIAKLGLDEAPLILKMSKAFISPDTGLGHLASSLGTPNVILHINNPMLWSSTKTRRVTSDTAKRAFRKGERDYGEAWGAPGRFTDYLVKDRTGQMEGASKIDPERITRALNDIFEVQK
jgi:ADP-heptose:LPS heptosyltransferase